jgi:Family of unknown function (DUF5662)
VPTEFISDLIDHKLRVCRYMQMFATDLFKRAAVHDNSKFSPEEFVLYAQAFPELQQHAYGSDGYKAAIEKIRPAIEHHYANNDHHPEYSDDGIAAMNLVQLLEMLADWFAASERSQTSFVEFFTVAKKKYGIGDQLFLVLLNTAQIYATEKLKPVPDPNTLLLGGCD